VRSVNGIFLESSRRRKRRTRVSRGLRRPHTRSSTRSQLDERSRSRSWGIGAGPRQTHHRSDDMFGAWVHPSLLIRRRFGNRQRWAGVGLITAPSDGLEGSFRRGGLPGYRG
jgi:hypothetical protein